MKKIQKSAFTLVELIVVITILAILGTIAFMSFQGYSRDSRDSVRLADVSNIKISLELFSIKTGKYPKPDTPNKISYSGSIIWYQGILGDQVTTNLKNLNSKPLDPLILTEYTYSVTESFKEYEVLALYEGPIVYNSILSQANAATTSFTPKVDGNYNKVFVRTSKYIVPTPSIITSESGDVILNGTTIRSQVVTNGKNIPKNNLISTKTGALTQLNLAVYSGSINKTSTNQQKIDAMKKVQQAYSGSSLATTSSVAYVLNQTSDAQLVELANVSVLKTPSTVVASTTSTSFSCPAGYEGDGIAITSGLSREPVYSPDGNFIVYINVSDGSKLYKKLANDTNDGIAITTFTLAKKPSYSPDGNWILYDKAFMIYKKSANDSLNGTTILTSGNLDGFQAVYSPDGNSIVFVDDFDSVLYKKSSSDTLDGIVINSFTPFDPEYSPDGNWIIYRVGTTIYKKSANDSLEGVPITSALSYDPTYSPDGNYIVYKNSSDGGKLYKKSSNDSLNGIAITTVGSDDPVYSPGGNFIVYRNGSDGSKLYKKCANF